MIDEEAMLMAAIRAAPADDAPRLAYADWLEDRGDGRAVYLRIVFEMAARTLRGGDAASLRRQLYQTVRRIDRPWREAVGWRFDVVLHSFDPGPGQKISLIKIASCVLSIGLKEAKDLIEENLPNGLRCSLLREDAEQFLDDFLQLAADQPTCAVSITSARDPQAAWTPHYEADFWWGLRPYTVGPGENLEATEWEIRHEVRLPHGLAEAYGASRGGQVRWTGLRLYDPADFRLLASESVPATITYSFRGPAKLFIVGHEAASDSDIVFDFNVGPEPRRAATAAELRADPARRGGWNFRPVHRTPAR